jgi:hypothetical protein
MELSFEMCSWLVETAGSFHGAQRRRFNADFRGRVTCLSGTQFSLSSLSIFPGLSES